MHKRKILLIDNSVAYTGALKAALQEAQTLSGECDFVFVVPAGGKAESIVAEHGFVAYPLPMLEIGLSAKKLAGYFPRLLTNYNALKKIIAKEHISIVQVNDFYNLLGVMCKFFGFKGSLITYVRFLPEVIPPVLRNLWLKLAYKYSVAVIAVSDAVLHQLPPNSKVQRIYDPVVLDEHLPAKPACTNDTVRLLYLGNYIRGKGQDHAVAAFVQAAKEDSRLLLKFAGGDMGLEKNLQFKQSLVGSVQSAGLTSRVSFEPFNSNIEELIKSADIVLNFSEAESFSMTCAEASYYGLPVIATRCGGPEEIIVHGETGLLVENKNTAAMKSAIIQLAADEGKRIAYGKAAAVHIRTKFTKEGFLNGFQKILRNTESS